jgi:hypothetical protein
MNNTNRPHSHRHGHGHGRDLRAIVATLALAGTACLAGAPALAATVTFDDLVSGATSYGYDGDADGINDVVFSTTDPNGFNTIGPGSNMTHIDEPGIEGTSLLSPDLRVDFLRRATTSLSFGYALNSGEVAPEYTATLNLYAPGGALIASVTQVGDYTVTVPPAGLSNFPEGLISLNFAGEAAYATFDFSSQLGRYIIDNVAGTFGSTERPEVPEPAMSALLVVGIAGLVALRRRR